MTPRSARPMGLATGMILALSWTAAAQDRPAPTPPIAPAATAVPPAAAAAMPTGVDLEIFRSRLMGGSGMGADSNDPQKYRNYAEVTAGATRHDGLFTLFQKDEHLYAEIKPFQFDSPLLVPIAIARGLTMAGNPLNFGDEWVITFHRVGDKVQLIRKNIRVKAPMGSPIEKAMRQNYSDSILMALPIVSLNPGGGMSVVIDLSDVFFSNFAQLPLGFVDRSRTNWHKVKAFANNLELEVQATFGGGGGGMRGEPDGVIDPRGLTIVLHYSLVKPPDMGYRPRAADDRVGHFLNATKDFSIADPDNQVARSITRWRLDKADPRAKLSPPKKQIIWYIEDTVPVEYRPYVEDGIREWNKAFEKIGYRDALAVRWQEPGRDDFDPEDINYCTFRWITTDRTFAMSGLRSNPMTGEIIDGDIIFDASWIKAWKNQYAVMTGNPPTARGEALGLGIGEVISPTLAIKRGFGQVGGDGLEGRGAGEVVPAEWAGVPADLLRRLANGRGGACQFAAGMQAELGLASLVMADAIKADPEAKLSEELVGQLIKDVVMHEVGHSLGLRHNFKASTMLTAEELQDTAITRVKGLAGSVMDYVPLNFAPKGQKQGDICSTTIGPYDYWAIEYAYKDAHGDESAELKKVAGRAPEHDLVFATDSDLYMSNDPQVNAYDLGSDPCRFAQDRTLLASQLLKDLDAKVVKDGESWSKARIAFSVLMNEYGSAADLVSSYVGGQSTARDHKGDKDARDPITPVNGDKQRESLRFLIEHVLGDKSFRFSPALLRKLSKEHWDDGAVGVSYGTDLSVNDRVLAIQKVALAHCLNAGTMARLQNQENLADPATRPMAIAEVFRTLTDGIFRELAPTPAADGKPATLACSTIRRNLQREYLRRLATIALGDRRAAGGDGFVFIQFGAAPSSYPADARSLARLHLRELGDRIAQALATKDLKVDDTCRAHLEELRQKISKVLDADVNTTEP